MNVYQNCPLRKAAPVAVQPRPSRSNWCWWRLLVPLALLFAGQAWALDEPDVLIYGGRNRNNDASLELALKLAREHPGLPLVHLYCGTRLGKDNCKADRNRDIFMDEGGNEATYSKYRHTLGIKYFEFAGNARKALSIKQAASMWMSLQRIAAGNLTVQCHSVNYSNDGVHYVEKDALARCLVSHEKMKYGAIAKALDRVGAQVQGLPPVDRVEDGGDYATIYFKFE